MNRRNFLKTLSASAAAAALPGILRAQTSANARLNLALIGAGNQSNVILGPALANPRAQIIAVCDVDSTHAARARARINAAYGNNDCRIHRDYREVLSRPDIDAVLIATPDHWHALIAVAAARAGKHIYCEKPAATSIAETRAMLNAVTRSGVACQIGSMQRSWWEFQRAIALARNGCLGKITRVHVGLPDNPLPGQPDSPRPDPIPPGLDWDFWLGPAEARPYFKNCCHRYWRHNYAFAGGNLSDWIGHHHDIASLALGVNNQMPVAIRNATAVFHTQHRLFNTAINYRFDAIYAGGASITIASQSTNGITLEGTEGTVHVDRGRITHSTPALARIVIPPHQNPLARGKRDHMDNFIDCALHGGTPRCPIGDAHCVTAVAHLANAAFRSGRSAIDFDPRTEQIIDAPDASAFLKKTCRAPWTLPA